MLLYKHFINNKGKLRTFSFIQKTYAYNTDLYDSYDSSYFNERTVEIPIFQEILAENTGKSILEVVGNVLSHYGPKKHDILDKYDKTAGVINQNAVDFRPSKKYDVIVSISTIEHIGYDELPSDPLKVVLAIENLLNCLSPNGAIWISVPIGYNPFLDRLIFSKNSLFASKFYLKRINLDNEWM